MDLSKHCPAVYRILFPDGSDYVGYHARLDKSWDTHVRTWKSGHHTALMQQAYDRHGLSGVRVTFWECGRGVSVKILAGFRKRGWGSMNQLPAPRPRPKPKPRPAPLASALGLGRGSQTKRTVECGERQ